MRGVDTAGGCLAGARLAPPADNVRECSRASRVGVCPLLSRDFLFEDEGPYALTPNTVELIYTLAALWPRGGPVQDSVITPACPETASVSSLSSDLLLSSLELSDTRVYEP